MGQAQSQVVDPKHVRIWANLIQIRDPRTRLQTLETVLAGPEYVDSAKRAGVYSHCLAYISAVRQGRHPGPLPGEQQLHVQQQQVSQSMQLHQRELQARAPVQNPLQHVTKPRANEKALTYFTACLRVLNIQEEVTLTDEALRKAYKKAALKAHPDKGGTDEQLQAVTKAYAYLSDILKLIQGQRGSNEKVTDYRQLQEARAQQSAEVAHVEPVRLNPKNLNLTVFNQMFEQTRVPDPDSDGYGDWLVGADSQAGQKSLEGKQKFGKDFNREVFNRMFEEDQGRSGYGSQALTVLAPQALTLSVTSGVELGRDRPPDYTAPANASLKYTDLKQAYTKESTFSGQVAGVRAEARDFESYRANREKAPAVYSAEEQAYLAQMEAQQKERERQRQIRAAQEMMSAQEYHERMKRLVLTG